MNFLIQVRIPISSKGIKIYYYLCSCAEQWNWFHETSFKSVYLGRRKWSKYQYWDLPTCEESMNTNNATSKIIFTQLGIIFILQIRNNFLYLIVCNKYYINIIDRHNLLIWIKKHFYWQDFRDFCFVSVSTRSSVYRNVLHHSRVCSDSKNNLTRRLCLEK